MIKRMRREEVFIFDGGTKGKNKKQMEEKAQ